MYNKNKGIMNTFYGKELNTMTFGEMTLLSVDIQILSFEKSMVTKGYLIEQSMLIREGLVQSCIVNGNGGDYNRERFIREFNGEGTRELNGVYTDYEVMDTIKYLN